MRAATIISAILVLSACLLRSSEAVTCTADATVAGCINCTTSPTDPECVAEAAAAATSTTTTTTVAPTSTTVATTTAAPSSASATGTGSRKIVRVSNLRYSVNRRIRINPTTSRSTGRTGRRSTNTNSNTNRNRRRRKNSGGRRGNARVVVG